MTYKKRTHTCGQLRLEAPVSTYLPEFRKPEITLRHLLKGLSVLTGYNSDELMCPR